MAGGSVSSSTENTVTIAGSASPAALRASSSTRRRTLSSACRRSTFRATCRPSFSSCAAYTTPRVPSPSLRSMRKPGSRGAASFSGGLNGCGRTGICRTRKPASMRSLTSCRRAAGKVAANISSAASASAPALRRNSSAWAAAFIATVLCHARAEYCCPAICFCSAAVNRKPPAFSCARSRDSTSSRRAGLLAHCSTTNRERAAPALSSSALANTASALAATRSMMNSDCHCSVPAQGVQIKTSPRCCPNATDLGQPCTLSAIRNRSTRACPLRPVKIIEPFCPGIPRYRSEG